MGLLTAGTSLADSLEEELATLLIDHPQIKAGQKTVEARRQEISKSWAGYFSDIVLDRHNRPPVRRQSRRAHPATRPRPQGLEPDGYHRRGNLGTVYNFLYGKLYTVPKIPKSLSPKSPDGRSLRTAMTGTVSRRQLRRRKAGWGGSPRQNTERTNRNRISGRCDGVSQQ